MKRSLFLALFAFTALLGIIQFASEAAYTRAGTAASFPHLLHCESGVRVYSLLANLLPASYVGSAAAECAMSRRDFSAALAIVSALPPSAAKSDLIGRIALAQGNTPQAASRAFIEAGDVDRIDGIVDSLMRAHDEAGAFDIERAVRLRMLHGAEHQNAVADIDWKLNVISTHLARTHRQERQKWLEQALDFARESVTLSPFGERYYLAEGNRLLDLGRAPAASSAFAEILKINPRNADAYAGMGRAAWQLHDRALAQEDAQRSRSLDPASTMLRVLDHELRQEPTGN